MLIYLIGVVLVWGFMTVRASKKSWVHEAPPGARAMIAFIIIVFSSLWPIALVMCLTSLVIYLLAPTEKDEEAKDE